MGMGELPHDVSRGSNAEYDAVSAEFTASHAEERSAPDRVADSEIASRTGTGGADEQFCSECGEIIKRSDTICPFCGVRTDLGEHNAFKKDRFLFMLLAVFGGGLGLHRFYVEQYGLGALYLLATIGFLSVGFPLPWIVAMGEGVYALLKDDTWFEEKFAK